MGEAKQRAAEIAQLQRQDKTTPRQKTARHSLVRHKRIEESDDAGMTYARHIFRVVDENGLTICEETPDGPQPVLISSIRQPIRKTIIAAGPQLVRA